MIVRHLIICSTCEHTHTLRIQVGHSSYQEHTFNCVSCHENIVVGMNCDQSNGSIQINEIENCVQGKEEGDIVNLSSEFTVSQKDTNRDMAFPALKHMMDIIKKHEEKFGDTSEQYNNINPHDINFKMVSELWPLVKKGWSLSSKGIEKVAEKILNKYQPTNYDGPPEIDNVLFDFCGRMLNPGMNYLFENAVELMKSISERHPKEFREFQKYYDENIKDDNLSRYFDVFSEFFKSYSDFSQTLTFMQMGIPLDNDQVASSSSFGKTKLFYGNAFEAFTSNITILALLNNIHNGRKFDEFESMTLQKYKTINKANRSNPFKDTEAFFELCKCLDSTIRNSSHHGAMKLDKRGRMITYQSGGTGGINHISYKEYIDMCNSIMLSSCALLSLELVIAFNFHTD